MRRSGPRMTSVGFRRGSIQPPRLFGQHDRNAVADRIGELGGTRDQLLLLAVVFQGALGERANQDFEQLGIDAAGGTVGCHDGFRVGRADLSTTSPPSNHSRAITATRVVNGGIGTPHHCNLVSPSVSPRASSISVNATKISARVLRSCAS